MLLITPCLNEEVKAAFIFCCYTGLRWVDVKKLEWKDIRGTILTTRIVQAKTGQPVTLSKFRIRKHSRYLQQMAPPKYWING